jgi:hypothetical protein
MLFSSFRTGGQNLIVRRDACDDVRSRKPARRPDSLDLES